MYISQNPHDTRIISSFSQKTISFPKIFPRSQDLLCLPRIGEAPNGEIRGVSWLSNNHSSGEVYSFGERLPYISMAIYLHPWKTKMELENSFFPRGQTFTNHRFWWVPFYFFPGVYVCPGGPKTIKNIVFRKFDHYFSRDLFHQQFQQDYFC